MYIIVLVLLWYILPLYGMKPVTHKNHRAYLEKCLSELNYRRLKKYLNKKDVRTYIAHEPLLFDWARKQTNNPLMIKLLIDNGINLDYHDTDTNQTIFHLITDYERLIDYDVILAVIARFITTDNPLELEAFSKILKKIDADEDYTAYQKGYEEEKKFLKTHGRPYLYVDPCVEIILYNQDKDFLKENIQPMIDYHNSIQSEQKFNVFKNQHPERNYIHEKNKPTRLSVTPSISIKLLDPDLWKRSLNSRSITRLFKKIKEYRKDHNYDQFPSPKILVDKIEFEKLFTSNSIPYPPYLPPLPPTPSLHHKNNIKDNTPLANRTPPEIISIKKSDDKDEKTVKFITIWSTTLNAFIKTSATTVVVNKSQN